MSDLIWIGNTLVPRGAVFGAAGFCVLVLIVLFVWLTPDSDLQ